MLGSWLDFHSKTVPVFEFVRRISVVLSVHADKTDEEELRVVVRGQSQSASQRIVSSHGTF
jgi:hypothetical protein